MNFFKLALTISLSFTFLYFLTDFVIKPLIENLENELIKYIANRKPKFNQQFKNFITSTIHLILYFGSVFIIAFLFSPLFISDTLLSSDKSSMASIDKGGLHLSFPPDVKTQAVIKNGELRFLEFDGVNYKYHLSFQVELSNADKELDLVGLKIIVKDSQNNDVTTDTESADKVHIKLKKNQQWLSGVISGDFVSKNKFAQFQLISKCEFDDHLELKSDPVDLIPK